MGIMIFLNSTTKTAEPQKSRAGAPTLRRGGPGAWLRGAAGLYLSRGGG